MSNKVVYVLGAGFTRAFVPESPLLVDDFAIPLLREQFKSFPFVTTILDNALAEYTNDNIDLEKLMTRLSGMPYDSIDAQYELKLLETRLYKFLVQRIRDAKAEYVNWECLDKLVRLIRQQEASIVTFNYDDVVDEALWRDYKKFNSNHSDKSAWHPDGGYGFYCRPSITSVVDTQLFMNKTRSLLLKLHGSINWRSRLGENTSRGPSSILHHEDWFTEEAYFDEPRDLVESHLEPNPFIIPPVLIKAELTIHPILNVIWKLAYEYLANAKKVVFIGYSLPETDLASRILFRETINRADCDIEIVDFALEDEKDKKDRITKTYRSVFPNLSDKNFNFSGAKTWVENQTI
jgi:hypothetical protein